MNTAAVPLPVRLAALSHTFAHGQEARSIVDSVDLSLHPGETLALIGRSGSGKSTLLNLISGLEPVQCGEIELFGQSVRHRNDRQRTLLRRDRIGFVYQSFNLIATLSVADNICLPLALAGARPAHQRDRLAAMLEAVGLVGREAEFPDRLSGGEQQRVALARALIHQPPLILADEPTGNLDADSGRQVLQLLTGLVDEQGAALLLVTHSLEVARVADRTLALRDGHLEPLDADQLAGSSAW